MPAFIVKNSLVCVDSVVWGCVTRSKSLVDNKRNRVDGWMGSAEFGERKLVSSSSNLTDDQFGISAGKWQVSCLADPCYHSNIFGSEN